MRTLADLIAFNNAHCPQELVYYGQEIFEIADQLPGYPNDPTYVAARNHATSTAQAGIDDAMARDHLDAIVAPHLTNSTGPARSEERRVGKGGGSRWAAWQEK